MEAWAPELALAAASCGGGARRRALRAQSAATAMVTKLHITGTDVSACARVGNILHRATSMSLNRGEHVWGCSWSMTSGHGRIPVLTAICRTTMTRCTTKTRASRAMLWTMHDCGRSNCNRRSVSRPGCLGRPQVRHAQSECRQAQSSCRRLSYEDRPHKRTDAIKLVHSWSQTVAR